MATTSNPPLRKAHAKPTRYEKTAAEIREVIREHHTPGDMLASERELAKQYNVSPMTMRKTLEVLVKEGVLQRYHRWGTVVADPLTTGEFAIVIRPQLLGFDASPAFTMIKTALIDNLHEHNQDWRVRLHTGRTVDEGADFPATLDLLHPDVLPGLRGVFSFHPLYELEPKLKEAKVPLVMLGLGNPDEGYAVGYDLTEGLAMSARHVREVGCKTLGFIWNAHDRPLKQYEQRDKHMLQISEQVGLEIRPEWIVRHNGDIKEQSGYDMFMRLWKQDTHPEALVVPDDIMCRGVLRAILHLGIDLPDDLRLVTMCNRGHNLPYHKSVTRYEFDPQEQARVAVQLMLTLARGDEPPTQRIMLSPHWIQGDTT